VIDLLARTSGLLRDDEAVLEMNAGETLEQAAGRRAPARIDLRTTVLSDAPVAIQRRVLRQALAEVRGGLRRITASHIEKARDLLGSGAGGAVCLPDGVVIRHAPGTLRIEKTRAGEAAGRTFRPAGRKGKRRASTGQAVETICPVPGQVDLPAFGVRLKTRLMSRPAAGFDPRAGAPDRVFLDADLVRTPLRVRGRRSGDRFTPLGAPGTRKLKSFLIDRKVPLDDRGRIPIVLSGGRIAWVVAQAIDDRFKVTPRTRRILVLEKETA